MTYVLNSGQADLVRQLFLDGPTQDGNIVCKTARRELVEAGLVVHYMGHAQLSVFGLSIAIERGLSAEKEIRDRDRCRRFKAVSDDSGHHYVIPVERADDWSAFVDQLAEEDADFDTPAYAYPFEGKLDFTWPRSGDVAVVEALKGQGGFH